MRRNQPEKREVIPDVKYKNITISLLINRIMRKGKKSVAVSMIYDALDIVGEKTGKSPVDVLDQALKNVGPMMEVRPRRVGGATYQVPMEVSSHRRLTLAMRWVIDAAKARTGKSFSEKFSSEILDAYTNQGAAIRKREETHKMAEANRAFSHYRM